MQWRITGTLYEADGKAASGQVEAQIYDIARKRWQSQATSNLNTKGAFSLTLELDDSKHLPAIRLCEPVKANTNPRVLAEGGLVNIVSARLGHLAFGEIERLAGQAITRSERAAPFSSSDDYLLVGIPRTQTQAGATRAPLSTMALLQVEPKLVLHNQTILDSTRLQAQANLSKQVELQSIDLKHKIDLINTLEKNQQSYTQQLNQAQLKIQALEKELKAKANTGTALNSEQIELATQKIHINFNEQFIKQATDFELQQRTLQRTLNDRNFELAQSAERILELSAAARQAAEEAARVQQESEELQNQLDNQMNADELYSSIAQQLQLAQTKMQDDGIAYRLGRVSLNVKTLLSGNHITLPTRSDLLRNNPGLFTDIELEYLPEAPDTDTVEPTLSVPDFSELTETLARRLAGDLGLRLESAYQSVGSSGQSIGQAIRQLPAKGTQVSPGDTVLVVFTQA